MALPDRTTANTAVEHVADHNVLHNWTQFDEGVRYVSVQASNASDSNDGRTPFEPMATISAAVSSLTTGTNGGGTVLAGRGDHTLPAGGLTISTLGVSIQGVGRGTRLRVPAAAPYGLRFTAGGFNFSHVGNFNISAADGTVNQTGILIEDTETVYLDKIWFQNFGATWAGTPTSADADPAALKIRGQTTNAWADWNQFTRLWMFENFRGFVAPGGGSNGFMANSSIVKSKREAVYTRRQQNSPSTTLGAEWFFNQCYFAGSSDGEYLVRLESDSANPNHTTGNCFTNCRTEPNGSSWSQGGHHFYIDGGLVMIDQHHFDGGGKTAVTPIGLNLASARATNITVGHYVAVTSGFGVPTIVNSSGDTTTNRIAKPGTDYSAMSAGSM